MSRLVTYVSDQGKKFPLAIGEDYNEEVRNEMAEFLVNHIYKYINAIILCINFEKRFVFAAEKALT